MAVPAPGDIAAKPASIRVFMVVLTELLSLSRPTRGREKSVSGGPIHVSASDDAEMVSGSARDYGEIMQVALAVYEQVSAK
jgi:hypothetical protein